MHRHQNQIYAHLSIDFKSGPVGQGPWLKEVNSKMAADFLLHKITQINFMKS